MYDGVLAASLRCTARSSADLAPVARQVYVEPLKPADPTELGGIALRGRLGAGGMGTVYYGVTPDGEQVAVKTIRADLLENPEARGRFDREVLVIGMVQGPRVANLVAASPPGEAPPWFAAEYVRGRTLSEYVTDYGPLPARPRGGPRPAAWPRRSPPSTRRASCTATSSRATSCSAGTVPA